MKEKSSLNALQRYLIYREQRLFIFKRASYIASTLIFSCLCDKKEND